MRGLWWTLEKVCLPDSCSRDGCWRPIPIRQLQATTSLFVIFSLFLHSLFLHILLPRFYLYFFFLVLPSPHPVNPFTLLFPFPSFLYSMYIHLINDLTPALSSFLTSILTHKTLFIIHFARASFRYDGRYILDTQNYSFIHLASFFLYTTPILSEFTC